jgi:hypothetical protein
MAQGSGIATAEKELEVRLLQYRNRFLDRPQNFLIIQYLVLSKTFYSKIKQYLPLKWNFGKNNL